MLTAKDDILALLDSALGRSPGDQTELTYISGREATTRFAENVIHQNMLSADARVIVRLIKDGRVAVSSTNDLTENGLDRAMRDAAQLAALLEPDGDFPSFVKSPAAPAVAAFHPGTDGCDPARRADAVAAIAAAANDRGVQTAGIFQTETVRTAVVNSLGTRQYNEETSAEFSVSASDDAHEGQGWAHGVRRDIDQLETTVVGRTAIDKAVRSRDPQTVPPGEMTVILEPAAVGQLLLFLGFLAFSGKSFAQGRSLLAGRIGEQVAGENITIIEDPFLPEYPGLPFDYEGVPKQKVTLIENGLARGVVHDRSSAQMAGTTSTGHALPADNARGPYPKNMVVQPGDATIEEMIASTQHGLLITHFWYLNFLNPMRGQMTGSTRDGTFLIANGGIGHPVRNLRATPALLDVFSRVEAIGRERVVYPQYSVVMYVPAMKVAGMPFTEATE
ncbi:MAG TPA: TldD/PmbA family protein [Acidobacteriota bacterium]|nr:TldD/PmbA family protein [Acidobacteriota bacterium]